MGSFFMVSETQGAKAHRGVAPEDILLEEMVVEDQTVHECVP